MLGTVGQVSAQRDSRLDSRHSTLTVAGNDTVDAGRVESHLRGNAPASPRDNGMPRFAIVGKDHMFYLGIGGQFLGEAVYDFGDPMPSPLLFTPSALKPADPGSGAGLGFAWQTSSIYLNIMGMPGTSDQIGFFFKGNFTGAGNSFHCHHIYARYRGATVGYTTSLFADAAAEPVTIDYEGPNGYPYISLFTASWVQKLWGGISAAIAIEAPALSVTAGDRTSDVTQRCPAVPAYVQYAWDGGQSHLRVSGIVRPAQYRDQVSGTNRTLTGLGVQLSGIALVTEPSCVVYNVAYGRGTASYLQDGTGMGLDAVALTAPGRMAMSRSLGLTLGVSHTFGRKVSSNLCYSHMTVWLPDGAAKTDGTYRYGDYVVANVIYHINRFVSFGMEYDYGHRKDVGGASLHSNRLQAQFAVTL